MPVTMMPAALADRLRAADLTYAEAGATAGVLPPGYHHLRRSVGIGSGAQAFTAAAGTLAGWQVHARAGLHVSASAATAELGGVVVLGLGLGAIWIYAPCRVVYVIDELDRRGFAYGTLPGHPERGEEAFLVRRHHDAAVTFTITAFSRPASPLAKAAGPVAGAFSAASPAATCAPFSADPGQRPEKANLHCRAASRAQHCGGWLRHGL